LRNFRFVARKQIPSFEIEFAPILNVKYCKFLGKSLNASKSYSHPSSPNLLLSISKINEVSEDGKFFKFSEIFLADLLVNEFQHQLIAN